MAKSLTASPPTGEAVDFSKYNTQYSFLVDHFAIAFVLRVVLVVYGEFHDQIFHLNYTDIDYRVFSDGAQWVSMGKSPYNRDGYRYTPLLAYMMLPNVFLHPAFGKVFFGFLDIVAAYLTFQILKKLQVSNRMMKFCMLMTLYNPVTINVSTRGNAESIMSVLTLANLLVHLNGQFALSGLLFGISVHFKIYPICYALPLYLYAGLSSQKSPGKAGNFWRLMIPNRQQMQLVFCACAVLFVLTAQFYMLYGNEFLHETYFYHLTRRDIQHNFSPYFYILRYSSSLPQPYGKLVDLLPFLSQTFFWLLFSVKFYRDLPLVMFLNTAAFVILNKVCTVQYFIWYLNFLPLIVPKLRMPPRQVLFLISSWFASMLFWLASAYFLEFQRMEIVILVWIASLVFAATNLMILFSIVASYDLSAIHSVSKAPEKKQN